MTFDRKPPRTWTVDQIKSTESNLPPPLLGEGMLLPGSYSLLAGPPGAGKTFVSMKLADCIASGEPFGGLKTRRGRVLYLSEEMSRDQLKLRSDVFTWRHLEGCRFLFQPQLRLDRWDGMRYLFNIIEAYPADLVIIDHLRKAHAAPETNDALAPIVAGLIEISQRCDCAILVLHHFRKPLPGTSGGADDIRGGTILRAEASEVFLCTQTNETRKFSFDKTRYQPEPDPMSFIIGWMDGKVDILWQS